MNNKIYTISVSKLHSFGNQSYKVLDNRKMDALLRAYKKTACFRHCWYVLWKTENLFHKALLQEPN